jgi:serine/threonine-protein kinase
VYLNLAATLIDRGNPDRFSEAEEMLRKSISLNPTYPAYANLGYLYIQQKRFREASESVVKALALNDKDYLVWGNLAIAYEGLKDGPKAAAARDREIDLLEKAAVSTPRDTMVQANLGLLYAKKKISEKALPRIQSALALSPDDANVLEAVGQAYENLGDRSQALLYIRKSLQKGYALADLKNIPDLQGLISDPAFRPK